MIFSHVNRRDNGTQILGTELQDIAPQHIEGQTPQHLFGQFGLAVAQPCLAFKALSGLNLRLEVFLVIL